MSKRDQDQPGDDFGAFRPAEDRRSAASASGSTAKPSTDRPLAIEPQRDTAAAASPPLQPMSRTPQSSATARPVAVEHAPPPLAAEDPLPRVARTGPARVAPPPPHAERRSHGGVSPHSGPRPRPVLDDDDDQPRAWGKIIGFTTLGIGLVAGAAALALLIYTPVDLVRDRLVREVKQKTGRDLVIGGKPSVTFWPQVGVSLTNVSLSNPPGMAGPPLATMKRLDATIQLWPLLQRRVQVDTLVLQSPRIALAVDRGGRRNWDFAAQDDRARQPIRLAQAGPIDVDNLPDDLRDFAKGATRNRVAANAGADGISFGRVRIVDGTIQHIDERTGLAETVSAVDLTIDAPDLTGPLQAAGTLVWRSETIRLDTRVMPARALLTGAAAQTTAAIASGPLQASYAGTMQPGAGGPKLDGTLTLKSPTLSRTAKWLGRPLVGEAANGPMAFKGRLTSTATKLAVSDGALQMPGLSVTGALAWENGATRPKLSGQVRVAELNPETLATFRVLEAPPRPPLATAGRPTSGATATPPVPRSIEDLLQSDAVGAPKPQVRGFTARDGWSEQPLDLSGLALLDADMKVAFNRLGSSLAGVGPGHASVSVIDRVFKLTLDDVVLHDGKVRGTVTLDGAAQRPTGTLNLIADGVALQPLLKTFGAEAIEGKGRVTLALTTSGRTERQMVDALSGKAEISVPRGAVLGYDLSKMVAALPQGRLPTAEPTPGARTEFTDLGATFTITRGIADNRDFRVVTKDVRAIGNGQIALGARTIDAVVRPKLTGAAQTPAGAGINLAGLDLPIRIVGPLDKPQVSADFSSALRNPGEVVETLKQLDRNGEVQDTVKGIIAGDDTAKKKARDFLNNLLKR